MNWSLHVLGAGSAHAVDLGASCAVLERDGNPVLLIDCGPDTLTRYLASYDQLPPAIYITHMHMDHVAGLERLFHTVWFDPAWRGRIKLFAHAALVKLLQGRVADYPNVVAEGNANFWEAFRLVALSRGFWLDGLWFDVFPARHHAPDTAFGVALQGCFAWTGDTRPIPETLTAITDNDTLIAHDCGVVANASHTGVEDLEREYPESLRERLLLYHYGSDADARVLRERGFRVAESGMRYPLHAPAPVRPEAG